MNKEEEHIYYLCIPNDKEVNNNDIINNINLVINGLKEDLESCKKNGLNKFCDFIIGLNEDLSFYEKLIIEINNILDQLVEKEKIIKIGNKYKRV